MRRSRLQHFIATVLIAPSFGLMAEAQASSANSSWKSSYLPRSLTYVSAKTVSDLNQDLSSVRPRINPKKVPYGKPEEYLAPESCLGYDGPLGPNGPLGLLGPLGPWGPGNFMPRSVRWSLDIRKSWESSPQISFDLWASSLFSNPAGPFSSLGPLGETGPLGDVYYTGSLFEQNDFAVQLRGQGVWTALGPIGPLGALGPLGPLGPLGAGTQLEIDLSGNYLDRQGRIVRGLEFPFSATEKRYYELVEFYSEWYFRKMVSSSNPAENPATDASYMVEGNVGPREVRGDHYYFTSKADQLVTVLVTPLKAREDFDLFIYDEDHRLIAASDNAEAGYVEWIQLKVPQGTTLRATVTLRSPNKYFDQSYRITVTPSTPYLNGTNIAGKHVHAWYR